MEAHDVDAIIPPLSYLPTTKLVHADHARDHFDWFANRSSKKLPGVFASYFWNPLLFQASASEPAVLHAVLALSAAHRSEDGCSLIGSSAAQEGFTLRQYSKSLRGLTSHLGRQNVSSLRVILVTCAVFIYMEYLRGNYAAANTHLQNGISILKEFYDLCPCKSGTLVWNQEVLTSVVDKSIVDAFLRLLGQARLLGQSQQELCVLPPYIGSDRISQGFQSPNQARHHLDQLISRVMDLNDEAQGVAELAVPPRMLESQSTIQTDLLIWYQAYKLTTAMLNPKQDFQADIMYRGLHMFYTMANIAADTVLEDQSGLRYDSHDFGFLSIITQALYIFRLGISKSHSQVASLQGHNSQSVSDWGWIPPLYFTAIKCRQHRIRLQAIRLLRSNLHKEGIWDAELVASVAQQVMEIEERELGAEHYHYDSFNLSQAPTPKDMLHARPSHYNRICRVDIVLPEDPQGTLTLKCRGMTRDGGTEPIIFEHDLLTRTWSHILQTQTRI